MTSKNLEEAIKLFIPDSNTIHSIVNGASDEMVPLPEGGEAPTVRKAFADSLLFKNPTPWNSGSTETDPLQLRTFTDGLIYWAPTAQLTNPIAMGASPVGDSNWKISPIIKTHNSLLNRDEQGAHPASAIDGISDMRNELLAASVFPHEPEKTLEVGLNIDTADITHVRLNGGLFKLSYSLNGTVLSFTSEELVTSNGSCLLYSIKLLSNTEVYTPKDCTNQELQHAILFAESAGYAGVRMQDKVKFNDEVVVTNVDLNVQGLGGRNTVLLAEPYSPAKSMIRFPDGYSGHFGGFSLNGQDPHPLHPIGLYMPNLGRATQFDITSSRLGNTPVWISRPFNTDFQGPFNLFFSGWQPLHKESTGLRGSMVAGSNVLTVNFATFDGDDVGAQLVIGLSSAENSAITALITEVLSPTEVVLSKNTPLSFTDNIVSFCAMRASGIGDTLTYSKPHGLTEEHLDRLLYVDKGGSQGFLTTRLQEVLSSTEVRLKESLVTPVTNVRVFYTPQIYMGGYEMSQAGSTPINDIVVDKALIEGFQGPAVMVEGGTHLYFNNLKTHGRAWHEFSNTGVSCEGYISRGVRRNVIDIYELEFCAGDVDSGPLVVEGSRPSLIVNSLTVNAPCYGGCLFDARFTDSDEGSLDIGSVIMGTLYNERYTHGFIKATTEAVRRRVTCSGRWAGILGQDLLASARTVAGSFAAMPPIFISNNAEREITVASEAGWFMLVATETPAYRAIGVYRVVSGANITLMGDSLGATTLDNVEGSINLFIRDGKLVLQNKTGAGRRFTFTILG